jgi:aryl sulfotransferase
MRASDFIAPPRRTFSAWARWLWFIPLYGLLLPLIKGLELVGLWPRIMGRRPTGPEAVFRDYRPSQHDVFVCSYFKAGTTWTLQIATQIAFRGQAEFDNLHHAVPWPDMALPALQRNMIPLADPSPARLSPTGLRVIKTHLLKQHVPLVPEARYIVVTRDPKDCCVSGYHFLKSLILGPLMPSVSHWVDYMFSRDFPDAWPEHLAGWWAERHRPNVLFMTYEEMRSDHFGAVRKIAAFMGVDLTLGELQEVVRQSSFAVMKAAGNKFEPGQPLPWSVKGAMMRRGVSGGSGELLTPQQQRQIDDYCRSELVRLKCDFPYDAAFGTVKGGEPTGDLQPETSGS